MRDSRFLILPSLGDHWGLVVSEAALSGCGLLLSTAVGSTSEFVGMGNGNVFKARSTEDLLAALMWASSLDELALRTIVAESRRRGLRFTPTTFANVFERIIRIHTQAGIQYERDACLEKVPCHLGDQDVIVAVDASRNRSGGARAYLIAVLGGLRAQELGIDRVHVWAPRDLLDEVPDQPWLIKHSPKVLERSLIWQLLWQAVVVARESRRFKCDVLFTTSASTMSSFKPMVAFSQDLLAYESGSGAHFGWGRERLRLLLIRWLQDRAFRRSSGVIFLTGHAARIIQQSCGVLQRFAVIPHGVAEAFKFAPPTSAWPRPGEKPVQVLYVSNAAMYKHQWVVVRAVAQLRCRGYDVTLKLIGGGAGQAQVLLDRAIAAVDPSGRFVTQLPFIPQEQLPRYLAEANLFVFASSSEAFGITLLEAMAAGLPIACSDRSSLPETLKDAGVYFNPEDAESIAAAVERLLLDGDLRRDVSARAQEYAGDYSWERCASSTWEFVVRSVRRERPAPRHL